VKTFQIDVLFAFQTAEHRRAFTIEKAKIREIQSKRRPGLLPDIPTNFLQQLRVLQIKTTFDSQQHPTAGLAILILARVIETLFLRYS
jgi:hypothetical protein